MSVEPWQDPVIQEWTQRLLDSYRHWTNRDLLERTGRLELQSQALFEWPAVVVSHGMEVDPILNYGNRTALDLWEISWDELVKTPSRLTAEPVNRAERERMLELAKTRGYIDTYRGVRITKTGKRFLVENALIWNVLDPAGKQVGQAATFARWIWLP